MKQVIFAVGVLALSVTACKKKELEINAPETPQESSYVFPTKVGSYWVYECFNIDSSGVETSLNTTDSVFILGDTLINGKNFAIYRGRYFGGNYGRYYQRDSSGYIINNYGFIGFQYVDFNPTFYSYSEPLWDSYGRTLEGKSSVTIPLGTFQATVFELYLVSPNGTAINSCGDVDYSFKRYMVSGIGEVYGESQTFYSDFIALCSKRGRRLIDYYIPE